MQEIFYQELYSNWYIPECVPKHKEYDWIENVKGVLEQEFTSSSRNLPGSTEEKGNDLWELREKIKSLPSILVFKEECSQEQLAQVAELVEFCKSLEKKYSFRCIPEGEQ